jgi:chaperonin GroES
MEETGARIVGIRRNWNEEDSLKRRKEYFTHYVLIEGLGAYGLGFVHLIGGLSKGATSALRQLLDAGTLSNLPAGFKARGARISDDDNPIQPGEFRDIDAGGAELSASLMPLPYKEPSQTLFALLGFLVEAGRRLASIADMQVGDGNQMAAVGTTLALLERGSMVMSAIHKRLHYAQSIEFRMLARGFGEYLPDEYPYEVPGASRKIKKKDFNNMVAVLPVADPNIFSTAQRITLAQTQLQLAQSAPQMHNMYEAYYRVYAALNVRDIDGILRPPQHTTAQGSCLGELRRVEHDAFEGVCWAAA